MDMQIKHQDQSIFHLTGTHQGEGLTAIDGLGLRPALLAPYRDLGALRHDFPVVLVAHGGGPEFVRSLSSLVDAVIQDVAPRGIEGERLRRHALQLETEIRRAVDAGATGTLAELWGQAATRLGEREGETLEQVLTLAGGALRADGDVIGCSQAAPAAFITHAWRAAQSAKSRQFHADLSRLVIKLSDILRAAFSHSQAGRQPGSLKASLGGPHQNAFDFNALSRIVGKGAPRDELPATRRERLTHALKVLESQRFFASPDATPAVNGGDYFEFAFDSCAAAAQAFAERRAEAAELVKALSIAELEANGRYVESEHDLVFAAFGEESLSAGDLARLPDYLVCIAPDRNDAPENANLIEMLSAGLPLKVLVQTTDLLEEGSLGNRRFAFGVRSARLATTAMGLGGMFVLQSTSSNLYAMRTQIGRGLATSGPALFSVFAGSEPSATALPPYLSAAAAMQSRAFPAFCYDAAAGSNWATRFSLANNPQPDADWPVETLDFVDVAMQRASERNAFTFADFMLCDTRYAAHFALVPPERWNPAMLPAADWLAALGDGESSKCVPYLLAVDSKDVLQRVIVDARLMQAAHRCLLLWNRLQEHGGVNDSVAERLLRREEAAPAQAAAPAPPQAAAPAAAADEPADAAAPAHSRDEAWIDTARCPSCNECQLINDRMFGYDERKQAFIKDLTAGSYRQLVEAAESCQVAIIHPGLPRDPKEPGLEELLARAEAFR
jgi:ferredoxin